MANLPSNPSNGQIENINGRKWQYYDSNNGGPKWVCVGGGRSSIMYDTGWTDYTTGTDWLTCVSIPFSIGMEIWLYATPQYDDDAYQDCIMHVNPYSSEGGELVDLIFGRNGASNGSASSSLYYAPYTTNNGNRRIAADNNNIVFQYKSGDNSCTSNRMRVVWYTVQ